MNGVKHSLLMLTPPKVMTAPRSTEIHKQQSCKKGLLPTGGAVQAT